LFDWFGILPDKKNTVRHFAYIRSQNASMFPESVENGDDFFKVLGLKVWYDGSPYTGSMYLSQAYQNSDLMQHGLNIPEGHFGEPVVDKQIFYDLVKKYHTMGWQVSIHSQGDQSTKEVLDMMEAILAETPDKDQRHRIEHGVLLPPELLDKVKALHMTASIHINHLYFYGNALIQDIIGRERAEKMLPVASLKAHGICYSLHADAPMYEEAPFSLLQTAVTRKTREGNVIGEHEKISVYDGLRSFTINSAWQLHMDEKLGTIEVGKYADFVVLDKNPLNTSVDSLRNIRVLSTIVNGEVLYSDN
jgi:predicted amidohydrolase YtcJ